MGQNLEFSILERSNLEIGENLEFFVWKPKTKNLAFSILERTNLEIADNLENSILES